MSPLVDLRHRIDTSDNGLIHCPGTSSGERLIWMDPERGPPYCPACGARVTRWVMLPEEEGLR